MRNKKRIKWISCIFLFLLIIYFEQKIFQKEITVNNLFEYSLPKPFVTTLYIDRGCGNSMKSSLKISGYKNLKKLVFLRESFQNIASLEISNNPVLEKIIIFEGSNFFMNMKGSVIIRGMVC